MDDDVARASALATDGRVVEAAALLEKAAANGDAESAATLGLWRLTGDLVRRDLRLARELFGRAAELGLAEAEPIYTALLANGAGGSGRRWAEAVERLSRRGSVDQRAAQAVDLISAMKLTPEGTPSEPRVASPVTTDPLIRQFPSFLTSAECDYLIRLAEPRLAPAVVVHPATGTMIRDPIRSSTVAAFPFVQEDLVAHAINQRIAAATGTTYEQGEPLQILSYENGQEYKIHSDALPAEVNQRVMTFLVYLNEGYDGGETFFPALDLKFRGKLGDGLLFANVDSNGLPHPRARHAGLPVRRGRKFLLSKWIRARALDLTGPPGRPL